MRDSYVMLWFEATKIWSQKGCGIFADTLDEDVGVNTTVLSPLDHTSSFMMKQSRQAKWSWRADLSVERASLRVRVHTGSAKRLSVPHCVAYADCSP